MVDSGWKTCKIVETWKQELYSNLVTVFLVSWKNQAKSKHSQSSIASAAFLLPNPTIFSDLSPANGDWTARGERFFRFEIFNQKRLFIKDNHFLIQFDRNLSTLKNLCSHLIYSTNWISAIGFSIIAKTKQSAVQCI